MILYYVVLCCIMLYYVVLCYIMLYCITLHYIHYIHYLHTYRHTNIHTYIHTYIQTLWLLESLDLLDRETKNTLWFSRTWVFKTHWNILFSILILFANVPSVLSFIYLQSIRIKKAQNEIFHSNSSSSCSCYNFKCCETWNQTF